MCIRGATGGNVKVRILATPDEPELDGVRLDIFQPNTVRDVSSTLGNWLIAQGYALSEMRTTETRNASVSEKRSRADDRRRRR
jgi:hypothetical protein